MAKSQSQNSTTQQTFRTPIVAVMGHVDHGKTTLLDSLRDANVVDSEAGGITQNTRAHQIVTKNGNKITFIDTPGHEAFSQMRSRGAEVTDFVLLVVAADDGLQPQTKESIKFAKATNTPIIVAINKTDLPIKSLDKMKKELADNGVSIEEYGGDVMVFEVSALKKTGLDELVEGIELLAEVNELKPNEVEHADTAASAYVLESVLDKHMGLVALCLLKSGKLSGRETVLSRNSVFKSRAFLNENQKQIQQVSESDPFWITGLKETLTTGETIFFTSNEKKAKDIQTRIFQEIDSKVEVVEEEAVAPVEPMSATDLLTQMFLQKQEKKEGLEQKLLPVIIKSATQGTLEAVKHELSKIGDDERKLHVLEARVGAVTEQDIERAKIAKGIVLSFQLPPNKKIADIARREKVLLRNYEVIYEMVGEVSVALDSLLDPAEIEVEVARAKVKEIFTLTNGSMVIGCAVTEGTIVRGYNAWIERKGDEIGRAKISSLRHFKEEVKEIKKGFECGIFLNPQVADIEVGDEIVTFKVERQ